LRPAVCWILAAIATRIALIDDHFSQSGCAGK